MNHERPRWTVGYQGETDYVYKGRTYSARHRAIAYCRLRPEVYDRETVPAVGTVMNAYGRTEFPPAEVAAFFPGYVAARFNPDTWTIEYDGPPPAVRTEPNGDVITLATFPDFDDDRTRRP